MTDSDAPQAQAAEGLEIVPLAPRFGAEIRGVDLSLALRRGVIRALIEAFEKYEVVLFREQDLTPGQLVKFSGNFGELDVHHMAEHTFPEFPEVRVLSNVRQDGQLVGVNRGGRHWHSDLSYKPYPGIATFLYGVSCPPTGGDTLFASMTAAWEALPEEMKKRLRGKKAVHDRNFRYSALYPDRPALTPEQVAKVPPVEQPLIRRHPATGRPSLFVCKDVVSNITGMDAESGRRLIDELEEFVTRAEFVYAHEWKAGDLVVWDNRSTMHKATWYDESKYSRVMYRTQTKGEAAIPA